MDPSGQEPLNREPPTKTLVSQFLTPQDTSYDRNHGQIPYINGETHSVRVNGLVKNPLSLSVDQLRSDFAQHEVTCALECAGNRRHTMRTLMKEVQGIDWADAAIMNCKWKGPRLRDVLLRAGLCVDTADQEMELHVAFASYQAKCQEDEWFEASVPLKMCFPAEREAILALEVNDSPLTNNHGYPVRVVLPGIVGVRWVKWIDRIIIQNHESPNVYQQRDYKMLPPDAVDSKSAEKYWQSTPPMYDMPINSAIAVPADGATVTLSSTSTVEVKGYAIPQGADGPVTRVRVSGDGGNSWVDAQLEGSDEIMKWCWVLWTANVKMTPGGQREILSCATDAKSNSQESEHSPWNLRGIGYSGYGRARDLTVVE
ncbi:sulfite oxidase [Penicillium brasilianum]|uniref:Sulfite oxidase n=1 Tax=Penicillium brasilianum TaxID=104259 RepID=A0A1S9RZ80_PENBI|nr:sulfite oxidase [Penicillium brasilianum]